MARPYSPGARWLLFDTVVILLQIFITLIITLIKRYYPYSTPTASRSTPSAFPIRPIRPIRPMRPMRFLERERGARTERVIHTRDALFRFSHNPDISSS